MTFSGLMVFQKTQRTHCATDSWFSKKPTALVAQQTHGPPDYFHKTHRTHGPPDLCFSKNPTGLMAQPTHGPPDSWFSKKTHRTHSFPKNPPDSWCSGHMATGLMLFQKTHRTQAQPTHGPPDSWFSKKPTGLMAHRTHGFPKNPPDSWRSGLIAHRTHGFKKPTGLMARRTHGFKKPTGLMARRTHGFPKNPPVFPSSLEIGLLLQELMQATILASASFLLQLPVTYTTPLKFDSWFTCFFSCT
jgi:hypothetical protein